MKTKLLTAISLTFFISTAAFSQRPPRPQGPPPRDGRLMGGHVPNRPGGPPNGEWIKPHDANQNGSLETGEFQSAIERSFAEFDKNENGTIEPNEIRRPPRNAGGPPPPYPGTRNLNPPQGPPMGNDEKRALPPFFFVDRVRDGASVTRAEFERVVKSVFSEMDKNADGTLTGEESRQMPNRDRRGPPNPAGPPLPPNARFIGAELRFGDKLVTGQPFSAETVIEDTRLLFDGTLVKKEIRGNIYRDGNGRTRREQPLGMVGGVNVVGSDKKPQMLIFINDFAAKTQYFLDQNNKIAKKSRIDGGHEPPPEVEGPPGAKTISEGTKIIEGVSCVGTRTEFEIPVGQIGNEKPLKVVSEKWFSPDLQVVVMSLHNDPISGLHVFKLVNIKRTEPAADLFSVPAGFRIENQSDRARGR